MFEERISYLTEGFGLQLPLSLRGFYRVSRSYRSEGITLPYLFLSVLFSKKRKEKNCVRLLFGE